MDKINSLKMIPKITTRHIGDLKFGKAMKVKLAVQVLSHSMSAALNEKLSRGQLESSAAATSCYCKKMNDIFDILNSSSPKDKVRFRRPLHLSSPSVEFLTEAKA